MGGLDTVANDDWYHGLLGGVCGGGEIGILLENAAISSSHVLFTEPGGKSSLSSIVSCRG